MTFFSSYLFQKLISKNYTNSTFGGVKIAAFASLSLGDTLCKAKISPVLHIRLQNETLALYLLCYNVKARMSFKRT